MPRSRKAPDRVILHDLWAGGQLRPWRHARAPERRRRIALFSALSISPAELLPAIARNGLSS